jgi:nucleoid DNA-binding protein
MGVDEAKWYRKDKAVINKKLAEAIVDALPLDIDYKKAKVIAQAVFDAIAEGAIRDGFVTIEGLGRFYLHTRPAHVRAHNKPIGNGKIVNCGVRVNPERTSLKFVGCDSLRQSLYEEEDGN